MTWHDAMDACVARGRPWRYRWLCSEANPNARVREAWRLRVVELATGTPTPRPAAPPPASTRPPPDDWSARIRACPDFNPGCCASPAPYCSRFDLHPSRERCIECLRGEDE